MRLLTMIFSVFIVFPSFAGVDTKEDLLEYWEELSVLDQEIRDVNSPLFGERLERLINGYNEYRELIIAAHRDNLIEPAEAGQFMITSYLMEGVMSKQVLKRHPEKVDRAFRFVAFLSKGTALEIENLIVFSAFYGPDGDVENLEYLAGKPNFLKASYGRSLNESKIFPRLANHYLRLGKVEESAKCFERYFHWTHKNKGEVSKADVRIWRQYLREHAHRSNLLPEEKQQFKERFRNERVLPSHKDFDEKLLESNKKDEKVLAANFLKYVAQFGPDRELARAKER